MSSAMREDAFEAERLPIWALQCPSALRAFGIEPRRTRTRLVSYSENATYICTDLVSGARTVLRLHRPGFRTLQQIRSELAWIAALRRADGISTPAFLCTPGSEPVARFAGVEGTEQHATLFEFADGAEPHSDELDVTMAKVGAQAARLHRHAREWPPPRGFDRPIWNLEHLLGDSSLWGRWPGTPEVAQVPGARATLAAAEERIRNELAAYGTGTKRFGLIHGDLRATNLLIDAEHVTVIDFDDCGTGWYMYDLACTLSFIEHDPRAETWVRAWIDGYARLLPLSSAELAIIPTMVMMRRLMLIAWMESRRDSETAMLLRGDFVRDSVPLAEAYLSGELLRIDAESVRDPS